MSKQRLVSSISELISCLGVLTIVTVAGLVCYYITINVFNK